MTIDSNSWISWIRGAARIMACEQVIAELIESIGDIIVLDEEERMYDVRPGIYDLGTSKTGLKIQHRHEESDFLELDHRMTNTGSFMVSASISEQHPSEIVSKWTDLSYPLTTLMAATLKHDSTIRIYMFDNASLMPIELPSDFRMRGEATSIPVTWHCLEGRVMEQVT